MNGKIFNKKNFAPLINLGLRAEVDSFMDNLLVLLNSGMDLLAALWVMNEEISSWRMRKRIRILAERVEQGEAFTSALSRTNLFSESVLSFIKIGEESGRLSENLKILVAQNEKDSLFRSRIRSALLYAIIIMTMTLVIGVGTAWYTLPKIADVYKEAGADLPAITEKFIQFGEFLSKYGGIFVPLFLFAVFTAFYFVFSFPRTRFIGHVLLLRVPLIKKLIKEAEVARFTYLLGMMLESGLTIPESLEAMVGTTTFSGYRKMYIDINRYIKQGNSLQESIKKIPETKKLLPGSVRHMIIAAEEAGALSVALVRIGKTFETKTEITAKNLPTILEPILLVIIGIGVAIFVAATMIPIFTLSNLV